MRGSIRNLLIWAICVSLAMANGFMPRHAHAMAKVSPAVTEQTHGGHDHGHHDHGSASKGHHGHDHGMAGKGDDAHGVPGESKSLTDNCCVASCSAIALIFATVELSTVSLSTTFVSSRQKPLVLAARSTDDPPPR